MVQHVISKKVDHLELLGFLQFIGDESHLIWKPRLLAVYNLFRLVEIRKDAVDEPAAFEASRVLFAHAGVEEPYPVILVDLASKERLRKRWMINRHERRRHNILLGHIRDLLARTISPVDQHLVKGLRAAPWQLIHLHGLAPLLGLHANFVPSDDDAAVAIFSMA